MDYLTVLTTYSIEIEEDTFNYLSNFAIAEVSRHHFGVSRQAAIDFLTAHYCQLFVNGTTQEPPGNAPFKSFDLDHEGYKVELMDTAKHPLSTTKWGIEYQRLLSQVTGNQTGTTQMSGFTLIGRRRDVT